MSPCLVQSKQILHSYSQFIGKSTKLQCVNRLLRSVLTSRVPYRSPLSVTYSVFPKQLTSFSPNYFASQQIKISRSLNLSSIQHFSKIQSHSSLPFALTWRDPGTTSDVEYHDSVPCRSSTVEWNLLTVSAMDQWTRSRKCLTDWGAPKDCMM